VPVDIFSFWGFYIPFVSSFCPSHSTSSYGVSQQRTQPEWSSNAIKLFHDYKTKFVHLLNVVLNFFALHFV
jgi:hypothetical protein